MLTSTLDHYTMMLLPSSLPLILGVAVWLALAYTAWVDGRTGLVPSTPIIAICLLTLCWLLYEDIGLAQSRILAAFLFYASIWLLNVIWRLIYKHDALGMGDASWSFLAVLAFGWQSVVFAWGAGAIIAIIFLSLLRLGHKKKGHVYFAPFLLIGLAISRFVL